MGTIIYLSQEEFRFNQYISYKLKELMKEKNVKVKDLAEELYEDLGLQSVNGAKNLITEFRTGLGKTSRLKLERLAKVIYALDVEEDDKIIKEIKIFHPDFVYPPEDKEIGPVYKPSLNKMRSSQSTSNIEKIIKREEKHEN